MAGTITGATLRENDENASSQSGGRMSAPDLAAICALNAERKELLRDKAMLKSQNEQLAAENISYRMSVPRLQANAVRLGSTKDQTKESVLDLLKREGGWLRRDCDKITAAFIAVGACERKQAEQAADAKRMLAESEKRRKSLEGRVDEVRERNRALEEEGEAANSERDALEARARKEASEAARLKREMERKIEMYEELRSAFDEERGNLKDARGEVEDLNRKLEEAGREIKEMEGRLARSQGRCKELEGMVQEGQEQLEEERGRGGEAGERAERLEARLEEAEARAKEAHERAEAAESKVAKAVEAARERQRVIDAKSAEADSLKEKLLLLEGELAEARERAGQDAAKLASEKRTEVAISKCSVAKLKAEASHLNTRLKEQRDVHKARLEELERHYDTQLAKVRGEAEGRVRGEVEMEWRGRLEKVERELKASLAQERSQVEERLAAQTARCDERVKEAERIGAERLQEAMKRQSMESAGLRERVLDAESALRDAGGHKDELERVKAKLKESEEGREEDKRREVAVLDTMEMSLMSLTSKLRDKEQEVQALQSTVRRECEERMTLVCQVAVLKQQHQGDGVGATAHPTTAWATHQAPPSLPSTSSTRSLGGLPDLERGPGRLSRTPECDEQPRAPSCPPNFGHPRTVSPPLESLPTRPDSVISGASVGTRVPHREVKDDPPPRFKDGGWGLPKIEPGRRGPSPAQMHETRMNKNMPGNHRRGARIFR